ncbi:unnamed protein product, partial [Iphiclides podalirius]
MTVSPKKHTSNFTTSTTNRGVEAKEVEIGNILLDTSMQPSSQPSHPSQQSTDCSHTSTSPPSRGDSASYIQVLVQKQRRRRDTITAPRLPQPSSPGAPPAPTPPRCKTKPAMLQADSTRMQFIPIPHAINENTPQKHGGCVACKIWPESLLACPAIAALHQSCGALPEPTCERKKNERALPKRLGALPKNDVSLWRKVRNITKENMEPLDGPERLDVYRFETGLATLSARGSAPTRLERALRRGARPAARLLAEALAAPRLLAALPAALLLAALRSALTPVRDTAVGLVQTASDYMLKPLLALAFNALLQPALACAMQSARAVRAAVRPLLLALNDAVEPLARLLAAVRLVHVERRCACSCSHAV